MELPHEIKIGVPLMREPVESALAEAGNDPATCAPHVIYRAACEEAVEHWMIHDDEKRLRCAIGVLLVTLVKHDRHDDRRNVENELRGLNTLNAMLQGVPIDVDEMVKDADHNAQDWVGLIRIWQDVRRDHGKS